MSEPRSDRFYTTLLRHVYGEPTTDWKVRDAEHLDYALERLLAPREMKVLHLRYECGQTFEKIGKAVGCSLHGARQEEARALRRIRMAMRVGREIEAAEETSSR